MKFARRRSPLLRAGLATALALASGLALPARAAAPDAPAAGAKDPEAERLRNAIAARVARVAMQFIREAPNPRPADFRISAILLDEARRLFPQDLEILRRLIEARFAAGDDDAAQALTAELVRLDPDDTVSQLRLITGRVTKQQDAPSRLAIYERLLGDAGASLDPGVRSRLALDDALLSREIGDQDRFVRRLTQAVQLDSTNKDAATLACAFGLSRTEDPLARVELLANVVLADPLDAGAHLALAREFMRRGAYAAARRFFDLTSTLVARLGETSPDYDALSDTFVAHWGADGAESELDKLNEEEKLVRYIYQQRRDSFEKAGQDPNLGGAYAPSPHIELMRSIAASAVKRDDDVKPAMEWLSLATDKRIEDLAAQAQNDPTVPIDLIENAKLIALSDRLWLRLLTGVDTAGARQDFEIVRDKLDEPARLRFQGLLAMREGDLAEAVRILTPLADADVRARIGLGLAAEAAGDTRRAAAEYARIVRENPGVEPQPAPPVSLWARSRLEKLLGEKIAPTPEQRALEDYASRLPRELDLMAVSPQNFMSLRAEHVAPSVSPLDRSLLRITVTNMSPIPLAVGPAAPINSSFLLSPRIFTEVTSQSASGSPEVASLDRRLSLPPDASMSAVFWADQGVMGNLLDLRGSAATSVRWTVVQGFRPDRASNSYVPGPNCLQCDSDIQTRRAAGRPGRSIPDLLQSLRSDQGAAFLESVLEARTRLYQQEIARADSKDEAGGAIEHPFAHRGLIAQTLADRLPALSEEEAAFVLIQMPPSRSLAAAMRELKPLDDVAATDTRRLVRMITLLVRAPSGEDEIYDESVASGDEVTREYASLLRDRRRVDAEARVKVQPPAGGGEAAPAGAPGPWTTPPAEQQRPSESPRE